MSDGFYASGEELQQRLVEYIRTHFSDLLGDHAALLDREDGLDRISELLRDGTIGTL